MSEIEMNVWRTVRAVTVLAVLVVLLLAALSLSTAFDVSLVAGNRAQRAPVYEPTGPGVRVQSYAEIVPGANQTAHAWALGPDQQGQMQSATVANQQELHANAESSWPRAEGSPVAALPPVTGRSGLGDKEGVVTDLTTPAPTATPAILSGQSGAQPRFVIDVSIVNLRAGPGLGYAIVGAAGQGERYAITARYADWWQVDAAPRGQPAGVWVHETLGSVEGDAGAVPTAVVLSPASGAFGNPLGAVTPASLGSLGNPLGVAQAPTVPALPPYGVEMMRHPEANTVVIYALIQDNQAIVGDLFLSVEHNGQRWRSGPSSYAVQGVTKPSEPGSPYNRTYNAKIDFPLFLFPVLDVTGDWAITLVDGNNTPLSVISTVTIAPNDPQQEIYFHYRKEKL